MQAVLLEIAEACQTGVTRFNSERSAAPSPRRALSVTYAAGTTAVRLSAEHPFDGGAPSLSNLSSSPHSSFARTADPSRSRPTYSNPSVPQARRSPKDPQARTVAETFRPDLPITAARAAARPRRLLHLPTSASVRPACSSSPPEHSIEWAPHTQAPAVEHVRGDHRRAHVLVPE